MSVLGINFFRVTEVEVSRDQRSVNLIELNKVAYSYFLANGLEAMTLESLSLAWGQGRGVEVESYYTSENLFMSLEQESVRRLVFDFLSVDTLEGFGDLESRWAVAMHQHEFQSLVGLMCAGALGGPVRELSTSIISQLDVKLRDKLGEEASHHLHRLIGRSIMGGHLAGA